MTMNTPLENGDVQNAVAHYTTIIAGLELLGMVTVATDGEFHLLRLSITEAVVRAGHHLGGLAEVEGGITDEVKAAALEVLSATEYDDLKNPLRDWIFRCPQIDVIVSHSVGKRGGDCIEAVELALPDCGYAVEALLVLREGDRPNQLFVTKGAETTAHIISSPEVVEEAFIVVAEDGIQTDRVTPRHLSIQHSESGYVERTCESLSDTFMPKKVPRF
jgi:hypothetical protein